MPTIGIIHGSADRVRQLAELVDFAEVQPVTVPCRSLRPKDLEPFDLIVTDWALPGVNEQEVMKRLRALDDCPAVLVVGEQMPIRHAIDAVRAGALDVVDLRHEPGDVRGIIRRALEQSRAMRESPAAGGVESLADTGFAIAPVPAAFSSLEFHSPAMDAVLQRAQKVAPTSATVLLTGESGTGKEVLARAIHRSSRRADREFVAINCAGVAPSLVESELFGHEKGAFTGALRGHRGCFERASGGTLLLDEIGELPLDLQSKLLRVVQERAFLRVGGERELPVNCRIIATTNRNLPQMVASGRFREDLYYRLKVVDIHLPPLRERPECILPLANRFLGEFGGEHSKPVRGLSPAAQAWLLAHAWPGNIRELRNTIESGVVVATGPELTLDDVPASLCAPPCPTDDDPAATVSPERIEIPVGMSLAEIERIVIRRTLAACEHNREQTARTLGIGLRTLYRRLRELEATGDAGSSQ